MFNLDFLKIKNQKQIPRRILIIVGLILAVILVMILVRIYTFYHSIYTNQNNIQNSKNSKNEYTFLLLGYGGDVHAGMYLTDTIMVIHINLLEKQAILLSLPRDILVRVPTKDSKFYSKINAVYQMGLFPSKYPNLDPQFIDNKNPSGFIKHVIKITTGLEIDAFAAIDFKGFVKAIDSLGGIDINVKKTFTDYEYPIDGQEKNLCQRDADFTLVEPIINKKINMEGEQKIYDKYPHLKQFVTDIQRNAKNAFPCRFEKLHFESGLTHMDGLTALKFARSRNSIQDGGDFNRAARQQKVLDAIKKKILALNFIPKIPTVLNDLEEHIVTDLPLSDINTLLIQAASSNEYKVTALVLGDNYLTQGYSPENGYYIYPNEGIENWGQVKNVITLMKKGITPTKNNLPNLSPTTN